MIDVHSHFFCYPAHFTDDFREQARRARGDGKEVDLTVRWGEYAATAGQCEKTIVFGGKARRVALHFRGAAFAISDLRSREDAIAETLAAPRKDFCEPRNLNHVDAEGDFDAAIAAHVDRVIDVDISLIVVAMR